MWNVVKLLGVHMVKLRFVPTQAASPEAKDCHAMAIVGYA